MNDLLDSALSLAAQGWHIHPLLPNSKRPALHGEKLCPRDGACAEGHKNWEQRASTNVDKIRAVWETLAYNIGIATGPSGLVVVDLDIPDSTEPIPIQWASRGAACGADVLALIAHDAGENLPDTFTVMTPSGGSHLYFTAPEGTELRNTAGSLGTGLGWKVDTRAHGGYVVAPGSTVDGRPYRIVSNCDPVPLPGWLADRLTPTAPRYSDALPVRVLSSRKAKYLDAALRAEAARVAAAPKGQRNGTLYVAAVALGQLVAGGELPEPDAVTALLSAAWKHVSVGAYSETQARKTIDSGIRAGARKPRTIAA
jgi:hypothetical protein